MANDRKVKENGSHNSKRRHVGSSSTTSGSATTDSLALRRSTRETTSKKQSLSSTSSTRKSERLEKRTPATVPIKKKIEQVEKQSMPSPLRKSGRNEKQRSLNSSDSKNSEKGLSSPDTIIKKKKKVKNEKQQMMGARVEKKNEKQQPKPSHVILKKKRLDARSYRALLSPQARISKGADLHQKLKREAKQSKRKSCRIGASDSKEVEEDTDKCSERMEDEPVKDSSQFSGEQHSHNEENHDVESRDKLPVPESSDVSVQSSIRQRLKRMDKQSQRKSCRLAASSSKEVEEDGDECSVEPEDKPVKDSSQFDAEQKNHHEENHDAESQDKLPVPESVDPFGQSYLRRRLKGKGKQPLRKSCRIGASSSKGVEEAGDELEDKTIKELFQFDTKQKNHQGKNHDGEIGDKEPMPESVDLSGHSSPDGAVQKDEDDSSRMRVESSLREDVQETELMESTSEGRSLDDAETDTRGTDKDGSHKRKRDSVHMDSDTYVIEASKEICSAPADAISSSPSESSMGNFVERCLVCSKRQRVDIESHDLGFCSCNAKDRREPEAAVGTGVTEDCQSDGLHDRTPLIFQTETDQNASSSGGGAMPDTMKVDSCDNIGNLECLAQSISTEHKSESSKFVEYWVPVELSNVQLEHYCGALILNQMTLRSCSKNDSVWALRDILIAAKKCCDHPYLMEPSLQSLLTKGLPEVEYLDVGIKASGKLQLLDKTLQEMKKSGLRALILFQPFDGSRLGDILDDFLRQRFGPDTYERVEGIVSSKKKQAAMNMFNSKERGRFVFLLESRACHTTIKLSSVDAVILFDSDWNPLIDLRGLQRIHIDSQFEQLKVFRFYTPCTIEEKILNLAKQDMYLDSSIQNINRSHCQMLLLWGASQLFSKLDDFHGEDTSASGLNDLSNEPFMNNVVKELLTSVPENAESNTKSNCSLISKVKQSGAIYSRDIPLLGESKISPREEEPPHVFWTKLLKGRYPRWRYWSGSSQRVRKRVQYFDESPRKSGVESAEVINKRKKVTDNTFNSTTLKPLLEEKRKGLTGGKEGTSGTQGGNSSQSLPSSGVNMGDINHARSMENESSRLSEGHLIESEERRKLREAQQSLHLLLKPEISKLCEILSLPGYIKGMAVRFLEYIMKNHHVNRDPVAILHAFLISVCWTAAALLKHKIDHKESLARAKHLLNFECKEEEAEIIYSKLRIMKKMFRRHIRMSAELRSPEDGPSGVKDCSNILLYANSSQSMASVLEELEEGEIRESPQSCTNPPMVRAKQEQVADSHKTNLSEQNDLFMGYGQFENICATRYKKLLEKQQEEVQKLDEIREKEKTKLDKERTLELALIRTVHKHTSVRLDKMNMAEKNHTKKIEAHIQGWESLKQSLEDLQQAARKEERRTKAHWLELALSGKSIEPFAKLPLPDSWFRLEQMMGGKLDAIHSAGLPSGKLDSNMSSPIKPGEVLPSKMTKIIPSDDAEDSLMVAALDMQLDREERIDATVTLQSGGDDIDTIVDMQPNREDDGMDICVAAQSNINSSIRSTTLDLQPNGEDVGVDATASLQSNGDDDRSGTPLNLQPNREDDGVDAMQSNGDSNRLGITFNLQPNREADQVDACNVDMQSNAADCRLDSTIATHSVQEDNAMDVTAVAKQPHRSDSGKDNSCGTQSCREENAMDVTDIERETLAGGEQHHGAESSDRLELEPTLTDSVLANSLPSDERLLTSSSVERCEPPSSVAAQGEAVSSSETHHVSEQVQVLSLAPGDVLPPDERDYDTSVTEPVQHLQLPVSMSIPSTRYDQDDVPLTTGTYNEASVEDHTSIQNQFQDPPTIDDPAVSSSHSESSPSVEDCSEPSLSLPQSTTSLLQHQALGRPSIGSGTRLLDTNLATIPESSYCPDIVHSVGRSSHVSVPGASPSIGSGTQLLDTNLVTALESSYCPDVVHSVGSGTHVSVTGGMGTIPESNNRPLRPTTSTNPVSQPWYYDPLQHEMERLQKEKEQAIKLHTELKLRLESERDKEIEQIRRKYAAMLQEAEAALVQKRKTLDANCNKVFMNKMLADAFRSKFSEPRAAGMLGQRQGVPTSFMELFQLSHAQRPAPVSGSPAAPPLQVVHQSSALFSGNSVRQPISPIVPLAGNVQVASELRAPAPHLQPFRHSTSMLAPNIQPVPHTISSQQALRNAASTSPMTPQSGSRIHSLSSGPFSRNHQQENAVGLTGFNSSSLSALELLLDVSNHRGENQPSMLPPLQHLGPTLGALDPPELTTHSSSQGNAARTDQTADVVCISDDD